jgi:Tetratricopeptide repeat
MIALATILKDSGRAAAAEPLLRRGMEIQRKTLGEQHSATIKTLCELGGLYLELGKRAAAEPILRSALEGLERTKGELQRTCSWTRSRLLPKASGCSFTSLDDAKTTAIMTEFYDEALKWHSATRGLAEVQRR